MIPSDPLHRVAVALDTADRTEYRAWCAYFGERVGVLKVGLEAFVRWGPDVVREAKSHGARIFLDLKLHDIPNTVAGAVASARDLGVDYLTVHASGGPRMLEAAAAVSGAPNLLAVTVLTNLDDAQLSAIGWQMAGFELVPRLAKMAANAGCAGVVCSPREAADLRRQGLEQLILVTPGIRSADAPADDQRRTATAGEALAAGSDLLVIGRPLTRAADKDAALASLTAELTAAPR